MTRPAQVPIRIDGKQYVLPLHARERDALRSAAELAALPVTTFVEHAAARALEHGGKLTRDAVEAGADACGLPVTTWLREVALAAADASPLRGHLRRAAAESGPHARLPSPVNPGQPRETAGFRASSSITKAVVRRLSNATVSTALSGSCQSVALFPM